MRRLFFALLLVLLSGALAAQGFPNRPIRFLVSFPAGGGNDMMARLVAQHVSERLGQGVVVENRAGGAGVVGSAAVAAAPADGYTVLVTGDVPITQAHLLSKLPFDPTKDLVPLAKGAVVPTAVLVGENSPFRSLKDIVDFARANPGKASWGTPGAGTSMHAELEMLKDAMKVDITHVPYKGAPPIIIDTIGGQITVGAPGLPPAIGGIKSGKLRLLGLWSAARNPAFPDVPTVSEATGQPSLTGLQTWYGFLLPRGVPADVSAILEREILRALRDPEIVRKLSEGGALVSAQPAAEFQQDIRRQTEFFAGLFKKFNIKAE